MFMQQGGAGGPMASRGGFNQSQQNVLQGPLAYLEKTTSNIGENKKKLTKKRLKKSNDQT